MPGSTRSAQFSGRGQGTRTKDGCSVELYRRLPYFGEIDFLAGYLHPGMSVLELGCGTGRLTDRLLAFGCAVTAVDNSREMLAHVPATARLVHSDIEHLRLPEKFDVVLLASCLVNNAIPEVRAALLAAAAAHLKPPGRFILERYDPDWLASAKVGLANKTPDVSIWVESIKRVGATIAMTLKYTAGSYTWVHSFTLIPLDEDKLQAQLSAAGFGPINWLDARRRWASVSLRQAD